MRPSPADRRPDRRPGRAPQPVQLGLAQSAGGPAGVDAGPVEDLVGQQVPHAGDRALVHQPRLDRGRAPADPLPELLPRDLAGVRPHPREVGLEDRPPQPPTVAQRQPAAVAEVQREPIPPARVGLLVHHDRSRHAQVQAQHRPRVGLHPQVLPAAVGVDQPVAGQRRRDLAGSVRARHVGVPVVHGDDLAPPHPFDLPAGPLGLGQLGQLSRTSAPGPAAPAP